MCVCLSVCVCMWLSAQLQEPVKEPKELIADCLTICLGNLTIMCSCDPGKVVDVWCFSRGEASTIQRDCLQIAHVHMYNYSHTGLGIITYRFNLTIRYIYSHFIDR